MRFEISKSRLIHLILITIVVSIAIYFRHKGNEELYSLFKPLATIIIILLPVFHGKRTNKKYDYRIIAALIFCLLGDTFLLKDDGFIYGLSAFLIAHLLFSYSFITLGGFKRHINPLAVLVLIGVGYFIYLKEDLGSFQIPVACYFMVIVFMCWQGISLYLWKKQSVFLSVVIAVTLFLVSDAMIAIEKFKSPFLFSGALILLTYWLSITLLANSACILKQGDYLLDSNS